MGEAKLQKVQKLAKHSVKHRETTMTVGRMPPFPLDPPLLLGEVLRVFSTTVIVLDDRGIEDVLLFCLLDDGWIDVDEILRFEQLGLGCLLILEFFITRILRCIGVIK